MLLRQGSGQAALQARTGAGRHQTGAGREGDQMLDNGPTESKERAGNPGRRQRRLKILKRRAML